MKRSITFRFLCVIFAILFISGCSAKSRKASVFTDVRQDDAYESAVNFCIENGFLERDGDFFGAYEPVTLSECASIAVRLGGTETEDAVRFALESNIAEEDYEDWDEGATRAEAAYMISHATNLNEINTVFEGAIGDVSGVSEKDEIYHLYRAGIFAGDKDKNTFRPDEVIVRSEMAIIIERVLDESKRAVFSMGQAEVSVIAFGDTIGHMPVLESGKTSDGYNFDKLFANVKKYIDEADIACVNQETIFTDSNFSGYPTFGSPKEIGIAEYNAGFDVITHATNHAYDRGESGIMYTTNFWKDYPVNMLGVHESEEDAEKIETIERNGITLALLNYTYGLNGFSLPQSKSYLVDVLGDKAKLSSDMERAKSISDGVIVFLHFGEEYRTSPVQSQKDWAQFFADEGALAIVGEHPHVVEPMEIITGKDGNNVPVYYSLGNFISSQNDFNCTLCAMASFKIVKDSTGTHTEAAEILPVVTHMEKGNYTAYLLDDYPKEAESRHRFNQKYPGKFSKEALQTLFDSITKTGE